MNKHFGTYKQSICFRLAIYKEYYEHCNCSYQVFHKDRDIEDCRSVKYSDCIYEVDTYYYDLHLFNYYEKYHKICPLECSSWIFDINTRASKYPPTAFKNVLNQFKSYTTVNSVEEFGNCFSVSIYYSNLDYLELNQIPKSTFADFLSQFGGTCGLFLGLSFLSFMEVGELIIEILLIWFESINNKRKLQQASLRRRFTRKPSMVASIHVTSESI